MEQLRTWLERATKIYLTNYERVINKNGELTQQECLDQEKGFLYRKKIKNAVSLYLKIHKKQTITQRQHRLINLLPDCDKFKISLDNKYSAQQSLINN